MNRYSIGLLLLASGALLSTVRAQASNDPEVLATPQAGERAEIDLQSIVRYGDRLGRFEVDITRGDAAAASPDALGPRRVRYVVDCEAQTITLAAVAVFDLSGQLQRSLMVPPGAVDALQPNAGTVQQSWLRKACR